MFCSGREGGSREGGREGGKGKDAPVQVTLSGWQGRGRVYAIQVLSWKGEGVGYILSKSCPGEGRIHHA